MLQESKAITKIEHRAFNLNDLISTTVQDYKNEIEKTDSKLKFMYTLKKEDIILVEGDRNRLNQLFANLLNNAIKFTKKGTISVSIQKKDNHVIISIKDIGQGIDPQNIQGYLQNSLRSLKQVALDWGYLFLKVL
jgi:signal transduction histidine kinase